MRRFPRVSAIGYLKFQTPLRPAAKAGHIVKAAGRKACRQYAKARQRRSIAIYPLYIRKAAARPFFPSMSKNILIISPSWIGDCVMTQPLYRRLHELHPGCRIDVFAPKWSMAVFERMPEINQILENPFAHGALRLRERWRLGKELARRGYDQVIVLPGSFKSALIARAGGIAQRTGYVGESRYPLLNDIRKLDKAALPLMVDR